MDNNGGKIFLAVTSFLSMLILGVGTTFSFFNMNASSKDDVLTIGAYKIDLDLALTPIYVDNKLIPTNDEDIMTAFNNKCVDIYGRGACNAYEITISNANKELDVIGKISFKLDKVKNLSYMLLNEDNTVYLDKTKVDTTKDITNLPLGNNFILEDALPDIPTTRKFKIIIWLSNLKDEEQDYDAEGTYSAAITYSFAAGSELSGSINGYRDENVNHNVSDLGGN